MDLNEPRSGKVIRQILDGVLTDKLDEWMSTERFIRRSGSMTYTRRCAEATQKLELTMQLHPSDNREASAAVYPQIVVSMPAVEAKVAELIGEQASLAGYGGPLRQPLEWLSEKKASARWFVFQQQSVPAIVDDLREFLGCYAMPFLDSYQTPDDLILAFNHGRQCVPMTDEQTLRIGAAMLLVGRIENARKLFGDRFGKAGRRAMFSPVLSFVGWCS